MAVTAERSQRSDLSVAAPAPHGTPAGQALFDLALQTAQTFFKLRMAGSRMGVVTGGGAGLWGVLNTLATEGPRTVPQIARSRPVARQHIQKLANELAARGLVAFVENPAHRRSKLLRLTPDGEAHYRELAARMEGWAAEMARDMNATEMRAAERVLKRMAEKLSGH